MQNAAMTTGVFAVTGLLAWIANRLTPFCPSRRPALRYSARFTTRADPLAYFVRLGVAQPPTRCFLPTRW